MCIRDRLKAVFYDRVFKGLREDMGETYSPSTGLNISETYPDDASVADGQCSTWKKLRLDIVVDMGHRLIFHFLWPILLQMRANLGSACRNKY